MKRPFAEVAKLQSVDKSLVERIFHDYQSAMLEDYHVDLPIYIGVDETRLLGELCFVCTDLSNGRLLDIQKGNSRKSIDRFFKNASYYGSVEVFCQDMHRPYKRVANDLFPKALIVVDRFHVLQQASFAMDAARKALSVDLIRPHRVVLSRHGRLFTMGATKLRPAQRTLLKNLKEGSPKLALAHKLKTEFASIYARPTRAQAEKAFIDWCEALKRPDNRPVARHFHKLRNTVQRWHREVFNYFDAPITNAFTEGMNRRLKEINRLANGMPLETLRAKALLRFGHFHRMGELANLSVGGTEDEIEAAHQQRLWTGIDLDELAASLQAGEF